MYVHPQEIDYNIETLFELIDASGLEFVGFSNPKTWQLERLLVKAPDLLERVQTLSNRQRYRLLELLDPEAIAHYEFFLARPPFTKTDWSSDAKLLPAIPMRSLCMEGWESHTLFNADYQVVHLSDPEWLFLKACDSNQTQTVEQILAQPDLATLFTLDAVRALQQQQLIWLREMA